MQGRMLSLRTLICQQTVRTQHLAHILQQAFLTSQDRPHFSDRALV